MHHRTWLHRRICLATACLASLLLMPVAARAADPPLAHAAAACSVPGYPGDGYFTSLTVKGVSCSRGKRVTLRHYRCRTRSSIEGRCDRRLRGFRCRETRNTIPTAIDGRVKCRRGSRRIVYTYQQNV